MTHRQPRLCKLTLGSADICLFAPDQWQSEEKQLSRILSRDFPTSYCRLSFPLTTIIPRACAVRRRTQIFDGFLLSSHNIRLLPPHWLLDVFPSTCAQCSSETSHQPSMWSMQQEYSYGSSSMLNAHSTSDRLGPVVSNGTLFGDLPFKFLV